MKAGVHRVAEGFSLDDLRALPRGEIVQDWSGAAASCPISFAVAFSPETLFFGGEVGAAPSCDEQLSLGQWVEGLWTRDVLELFVGEQGCPGYLELNLAPTGAWWACAFERYRQRRTPQRPPPRAEVRAGRDASSWWCSLALPLAEIGFPLDPERLCVCSILGDPRRFYTDAVPPPTPPDFHALLSPP